MTVRAPETSARLHPAVVVVVALAWVVFAAMTIPELANPGNPDYSFFTAIAERLRAGDRLYVDVWDNKDPFVFYALAIARTAGVAGAWLLELLWVVMAALSALVIAVRTGIGRNLAVFTALVLSPFVVLGYVYFMGTTHLPGVALTLAALALYVVDRPALAGIAVGLVVFFKLIMAPLALAIIIAVVIVTRRRQPLVRFLIGLVALVAVVSVVMAIRGEFGEYLQTQVLNFRYSQSPIVSADYVGPVQKVAQHVVVLVNPHVFAILVASLAVLAFSWWSHRRAGVASPWTDHRVLWWTTATAFVVAGVILLLTGKWLHHAEILAVPSVLVMVLLAGTLRIERRARGWVTALVASVIAVLLAGMPMPSPYVSAIRDVSAKWTTANTTDPLTEILRGLEPTSIAFVGEGNLVPRSGGLDGWTIACRHIAQRPFEPESTFTETLNCLPSAGMVVVSEDVEPNSAFPANNQFLAHVNELLATGYDCTVYKGFRTFNVCRKAGT